MILLRHSFGKSLKLILLLLFCLMNLIIKTNKIYNSYNYCRDSWKISRDLPESILQ